MQAQAVHWWPEIPAFARTHKPARKARQQNLIKKPDVVDDLAEKGDLRAVFDAEALDSTSGKASSKDWVESVAKNAFWQAVDAIRSHKSWKAAPAEQSLFGGEIKDIDGNLIVELSWVFGAEGSAPLPFEACAEAVDIDPSKFRRICQRAFPYECAWIDANVGPLQGV